jgi:beta-glucosidase/6-phospho-beta-glucosidase/beta-galactosidase
VLSFLLIVFFWASVGGYGKRFGLYFVDYKTQKRTAKPAVAWYRKLIAERKIPEAL